MLVEALHSCDSRMELLLGECEIRLVVVVVVVAVGSDVYQYMDMG